MRRLLCCLQHGGGEEGRGEGGGVGGTYNKHAHSISQQDVLGLEGPYYSQALEAAAATALEADEPFIIQATRDIM